MNEKTEQLIHEIAEKLGTTTEHLWGVLVKQASITATTSIVTIVAMVSILIFLYRLVQSKTKTPEADEKTPYPSAEWDGDAAAVAWVTVLVYGAITLIAFFVNVCTIITATLNPEYWALKQLLP